MLATPLPLLALTKMNQTTFNVTFAMTRAYVSDDATKELIISSNSSSAGNGCYGSAKLEVKLTGYFRIDKAAPAVCVGVGCVGFHLLEKLSWEDALYLSVVSVTTVGYGEIPLKTTLTLLLGASVLLGKQFV
ncbi:hypothetical protein ACFX1X_045659 [Malus domestica]